MKVSGINGNVIMSGRILRCNYQFLNQLKISRSGHRRGLDKLNWKNFDTKKDIDCQCLEAVEAGAVRRGHGSSKDFYMFYDTVGWLQDDDYESRNMMAIAYPFSTYSGGS